jgi:hypothetical protein
MNAGLEKMDQLWKNKKIVGSNCAKVLVYIADSLIKEKMTFRALFGFFSFTHYDPNVVYGHLRDYLKKCEENKLFLMADGEERYKVAYTLTGLIKTDL